MAWAKICSALLHFSSFSSSFHDKAFPLPLLVEGGETVCGKERFAAIAFVWVFCPQSNVRHTGIWSFISEINLPGFSFRDLDPEFTTSIPLFTDLSTGANTSSTDGNATGPTESCFHVSTSAIPLKGVMCETSFSPAGRGGARNLLCARAAGLLAFPFEPWASRAALSLEASCSREGHCCREMSWESPRLEVTKFCGFLNPSLANAPWVESWRWRELRDRSAFWHCWACSSFSKHGSLFHPKEVFGSMYEGLEMQGAKTGCEGGVVFHQAEQN